MGWKERQQSSHVEDPVQCSYLTVLGLKDCLTPEFASELPAKEKGTFDLTSQEKKNWANAVRKNKKTMM